eukprot:3234206-Rhodomonas_salina.4
MDPGPLPFPPYAAWKHHTPMSVHQHRLKYAKNDWNLISLLCLIPALADSTITCEGEALILPVVHQKTIDVAW